MTQEVRRPVVVKLLYLPGCPLVNQLRHSLHDCLTRSGASMVMEELEGPYPSPTLLIDGADATGKGLLEQLSCRLDLPTEEQITAALARASGGWKSPAEAAGRR